MKWVRSEIDQLTGYVPGEQPSKGGLVKLNTNENPYPPSPRVIEAIKRACTEDLRLYPDSLATELREAAASRYGVKPEQVLVGNGSDDLLAMIARAAVGPGDRVSYPTPTYTLYDTLVSIQQGRVATVPFGPGFVLPDELADIEAKLTFICNPNSPSGTWIPVEKIEQFAACRGGLVVVDEAYVDFAEGTALPLVSRYRNLVVLRTFSKSFSLAGMRLGLAFASEPIIATLAKVKDSYNVSRLAIAAGVAALEDYAWMERNVARIRATRKILSDGLGRLGFQTLPSKANFVMARRPNEDLKGLCQGLRERGILVRYFPTESLRNSLRITVGTDAEVERLLSVLGELVPA